ncbi:MAG: hypothetical protein ABI615_03735 [Chthoniobacterales bacterium]
MTKRLLPVLFLFVALLASAKANPDLAEHYLSKIPQYLGKQITVQVSYISPYAAGPMKPDVAWFNANTASKNRLGGALPVRVNQKDADAFSKKYGTAAKYGAGNNTLLTQPLTGVFSQTKLGKSFIDCTTKK